MKTRFFDRISNAIKERTTKDEPSVIRGLVVDKSLNKSDNNPVIDFDAISMATVASRPNKHSEPLPTKPKPTGRKSFYDRIKAAVRTIWRTPLARDNTNCQMKELCKKQEHLFKRLEDILQAD